MSLKDLQQAKNIGKVCAERIFKAGIENIDEMKKLGTEELFLRIFEANGYGSIMCTCFLYALEGAIIGEKWNEIPDKRKKELQQFMKQFRKSFNR